MWKADETLLIALEASKKFARRTEYMMMYWPNSRACPFSPLYVVWCMSDLMRYCGSTEQRKAWQDLRFELVAACLKSGVPPPDPSLPGTFSELRNRLLSQISSEVNPVNPVTGGMQTHA